MDSISYVLTELARDIKRIWEENPVVRVSSPGYYPPSLTDGLGESVQVVEITEELPIFSSPVVVLLDAPVPIQRPSWYLTLVSLDPGRKFLIWTEKEYKCLGDVPVLNIRDYIHLPSPVEYYRDYSQVREIVQRNNEKKLTTLLCVPPSLYVDVDCDICYTYEDYSLPVEPMPLLKNIGLKQWDCVLAYPEGVYPVATRNGGIVMEACYYPEMKERIRPLARKEIVWLRKDSPSPTEWPLVDAARLIAWSLLFKVDVARFSQDLPIMETRKYLLDLRTRDPETLASISGSDLSPSIEEWRRAWVEAGGEEGLGRLIAVIYDSGLRYWEPKVQEDYVHTQPQLPGENRLEWALSAWNMYIEGGTVPGEIISSTIEYWMNRVGSFRAPVDLDEVRRIRTLMGEKDIQPELYLPW